MSNTPFTLLRRRTVTLDPAASDLPEGIVGSEFEFMYVNSLAGRSLRGRITGYLCSDRGTLLLRVMPFSSFAGIRATYIARDPDRQRWIVCFDGLHRPREHLFDGHPGYLTVTGMVG